jgi:hypothetical protein
VQNTEVGYKMYFICLCHEKNKAFFLGNMIYVDKSQR